MGKRKLKRQLSLIQVIMLGTAGTIAAEIFVLTGHAAGIAGPDAVLALVIGGVLTLSIALNYCELATTYPVTGGAMTYVREAFGENLVMFLVGSLDCLSSTFYAALSAVGFAYSLKVFLPFIPVVPVAIAIIVIVSVMHIRGVKEAGNLQIILGGFLLLVFAAYVILGLTRPTGFHIDTFQSGRILFENQSIWANVARMLMAIALVYNAYVGFEVIADDAEEITRPNRNIPLGILISLGVATLVYSLVSLVTIGTIPYSQLAGSETALTDAARQFWPVLGVPLMGAAGLVATLTSVNSAMLSATREAFTLSRVRVWPRIFARLSHWRTPYVSIIVIGLISCLVAAVGLVDFLSFISSAGYMFVLFWASLAMVKLRKMHPNIERPFKVPWFPLTAYLAAGSGVLIIAFANKRALLFLGGVLVVLSLAFFASRLYRKYAVARSQEEEDLGGGRMLVAAVNPKTAESLVQLASRLAEHQEDTSICLLSVVKISPLVSPAQAQELLKNRPGTHSMLLERTGHIAMQRNVAIYAKRKAAATIAEGILQEANARNHVRMILMGWPVQALPVQLEHNVVKEVLISAHKDVGVLRDRGMGEIKRILVPIGGGPNARLALRVASQLAYQDGVEVTALHLTPQNLDVESAEDQMLHLQEIVEEELGRMPHYLTLRTAPSANVVAGVLAETHRDHYDLLIIGASEEVFSPGTLFGRLNDQLMEEAPCSMLIVRRYQPETVLWLQHQFKRMEE